MRGSIRPQPLPPSYTTTWDTNSVDAHARSRLRSWLRKKHKMPDRGTARFPDTYLENSLGLKKLKLLTRDFPWATA